MIDSSSTTELIRSELASDPDMQDLIRLFVDEFPERIDTMRSAWEREQRDELMRLAHQLKGAAPGYGFPQIGRSAAMLEDALKGLTQDLRAVQNEFDTLIRQCGRVAC